MKNTVTVTSTGLPKNNSDFGEKTITAEVKDDKDTVTVTKKIKVFYPAKASNSPSKASGTSDPNWFTYYKQAAGGGSYKFVAGPGRSSSTSGGKDSSIKIRTDGVFPYGEYIKTIINSQGFLKAVGFSQKNYYYRNFVGVLAHERQHANGQLSSGFGGPLDPDGDRLSTTFEINTSKTDPNDDYSAVRGTTFGNSYWLPDREIYAGGPVEENAYKNASSDTDWASPGGQY